MGKLGYLPKSNDSKIAYVLGLCSLVGAVGAVASTPLSTLLAKRINTDKFTLVIGIITTLLGCLTLYKAFF